MRLMLFIVISLLGTVYDLLAVPYRDGGNIWQDISVYDELTSLIDPTDQDWKILQNYLSNGERSIIKLLCDYEPNMRRFRLYGDDSSEKPQKGVEYVNSDANYRENCLIVYSSFNKNYPRGLRRLVENVKHSDFKGHILWQLGGWPDLHGGSLKLAHVPYAFKVCMFREAKSKGYQKVFWLDTSLLPVGSLNRVFDVIEERGYFAVQNSHMIGPWMNEVSARAFNLTLEDTQNIVSCCGGIFGVDFRRQIGNLLIEKWYQAAQNKVAFFSPRSDQNVLSVILHSMGLKDLIPLSRIAHGLHEVNADSLLLIEREYVNECSMKKGERL